MTEAQGEFFGGEPPSFAPPGTRSDRIGVIDVGSNSVRMVVYDGPCRSPQVLFNEKVLCGLGAELGRTGRLAPEGVERAMRALVRFAALAPQLRVGALAGIATAAVREAEDGPEFREAVHRRTGIRLHVASGAEEAQLAAKGVLFGKPDAAGVVADLGGASLEFCALADGRPGEGVSTPLGPLRLRALKGPDADREIRRHLSALPAACRRGGGTLFLVGGAFRALARAEMARTDYPLIVLHEYALGADAAHELGRWAARQKSERLAELPGVSSSRTPDMPLVGRLLSGMIEALAPAGVEVSGFGLREGVCLDNLPAPVREEDVLLAGAAEQESRRGRAQGFGAELGAWTLRLLPPADAAEARLFRAAALLSDVNWRTHPDHRAQGCIETVTRVTLSDLGHAGRAFLGAALIARHKGAKRANDRWPALALLSEERLTRATQLGLGLRLGGTVAGFAPGVLAYCDISRAGGELVLALRGPAAPFAGEEVEKRLAAFARANGMTGRLVTG